MITVTGWTFDQVDALAFGDAILLLSYWRREPPPHIVIGGLMKALAKDGGPFKESTKEEIEAGLRALG